MHKSIDLRTSNVYHHIRYTFLLCGAFMDNTCCFFGHRNIFESVDSSVYEKICNLIETQNISTFIVGDYGDFDKVTAAMVRKAKKKYNNVKLILVRPYFSNELNTNKDYYAMLYDDIIIPDELSDVHFKNAIRKRNEWMIDNSQYVIFYVRRNYGGAYTALRYAQNRSKNFCNIADK